MKGKYQKQLGIVFMGLGAVFIFIFIMILGITLTNSLKSKYLNSIKQSVSSNNTLAEISLSTVNTALGSMYQSASIQQWYSSNTKSSFYYNAIKVHQDLNTLRSTFSNIPFFPAVTRLQDDVFVISSLGSSSKEEYFESETTLSEAQVQTIFNHFNKNTGELILPSYNEEQELEELYYITRKTFDRKDLLYIIRIPKTSILGNDSTLTFMLFNENQILAYSRQDSEDTEKMDHIYRSIQADYSALPLSYEAPVSVGDSRIFISQIANIPWKIAYVYDDANIDLHALFWPVFLPFLGLFVLFYLIFRLIANWLYHPIKEVMGHVEIPGSASMIDEFQLLRQNAVTVKDLSGQLKTVMGQNDSLITQRFYRDIVSGVDIPKYPLYKDMILDERDYCVALFHFNEPEEQALDQDIFFSKNSLMAFTQQDGSMQGVNISHTDCAVLIPCTEPEVVREQVNSLIALIPEEPDFIVAISGIRSGLGSVHASYMEACNILEYKYLFIGAQILTAEQVFKEKSINYYYPIVMENRLIQNTAEGNEQALQVFDDLIRENFSHRDLTPETLRSLLYAFFSTLTRVFQELKTTPEELLGHPISYEEFYNNWNNPNIIRSIRELLHEIISAVQSNNASSDSRMLTEMQKFIYEHYSTDIMLGDMADSLDISAKYCSNLFKKLSDDNFKNFLNRYRIERAKEMIEKNPEIKISDLSLMVGFNSSNTFIRVFGKYTGMTPGNYLKSMNQNI